MPRLLSLLFTTFKFTSKYPQKSCAFQPLFSTVLKTHNHPVYIRGGALDQFSPFSSSSSSSSSAARTTSLSSSSNSVNGEGSFDGETKSSSSSATREGQTGWNHNLPKETSSFWTESSDKDRKDSFATTSSQDNDEPKTGWLHTKKKNTNNIASTDTPEGDDDSSTKTPKESTARKLLKMAKLKQKINHRIISPPTFHPVSEGRRVAITEHTISVPLNHDDIKDKNDLLEKENVDCIDVYFSIVDLISTPQEESFYQSMIDQFDWSVSKTPSQRVHEQQKRASDYTDFIAMKNADKCILYLQGGPGFGAPQPINGIGLGDKSSWAGAALGKGYTRIVLMDQRGTGRSSTITKQTLEKKFPDLFILDDISPKVIVDGEISSIESVNKELDGLESASESEKVKQFRSSLREATTYMTRFRADSIVKDAEAIKEALMIPLDDDDAVEATPRPWGAALGQSFGGFCMMSYLSLIPNPPKICLLTGGIAPMLTNVDEVYTSLRDRVKKRNLKYYDTYPGDVLVVKRIVKRLLEKPASLPSGGILTARRFLQVGIDLGGSPSAFASLHSLFASAFISDEDDDLTRAFLKNIDSMQSFDDHPIYCLLHESIYVDSNSECAKSDWSAMKAYAPEHDFDCTISTKDEKVGEPTLLVGEVVFPWMVDGDYAELSGLSMRALAHSLSSKDDWSDLYDPAAMRNALSTVSKAAAAVYYDDMYVDFNASMKVTERGNPLEKCAVWVTNDYQHSGLRDDGAAIFGKLLGMAKGEVGTPS